MSIFGCVPVFEEADNIGYCVESMLAAGCDTVVVLDGAYLAADGSTFMDGGTTSKDGTVETAELAGARVIIPDRQPHFGEKRQMLLEQCGAEPGDHVLFLDADERAVGTLNPDTLPAGHGCVILKNEKPNDMPGHRGVWPRGDAGPLVPLLRWLRWSPTLTFDRGKWSEDGEPLRPYLVQRLRAAADSSGNPLITQAHAALQLAEQHLTPALASAYPIVPGFEIHHVAPHSPERISEKYRFYA